MSITLAIHGDSLMVKTVLPSGGNYGELYPDLKAFAAVSVEQHQANRRRAAEFLAKINKIAEELS